MKLIFMGTPSVAVPCLEALHARHEVLLAVTQPDKPVRRGHKMITEATPVKARAHELGITVAQPTRARDESFVEGLRALRPEAICVVAYGQILPSSILDLPRDHHAHGVCLNVHFSLLPRWRGAAPVQYAIWHGDAQTGVTVQEMALQLDAGDILLQRAIDIEPEETGGQLLERLTPTPQNSDGVTLAPQIKREWGQINWTDSARKIHNTVRAFNPWPTAWTNWRDEPLKIWSATPHQRSLKGAAGTLAIEDDAVLVATGDGTLQLQTIQPAGKPKMSALDWARGARLENNARFEAIAVE
jgi:methionyl-tRNA formyltransferase